MTLSVGQELWFVPSDSRYRDRGHVVQVKKIGRKWAELSAHGRMDIETLCVDGGAFVSPGRCWQSKDAFEAEERRQAAWNALRHEFGLTYSAPDGVTFEDMEKIKSILRPNQQRPEDSR